MAQPLMPECQLAALMLLLDPMQSRNEIHRLPQGTVADEALIQRIQRLIQHGQGLRPVIGLLADLACASHTAASQSIASRQMIASLLG